ncbi:MAG: hypothetical protein JSV99_09095 [Planctomycetota bacterium]|nr:MAG: hypothetical protein JSV99_09095 [Planctomycetota bacterium]
MEKEMRSIVNGKFSFCELAMIGLLGMMLVSGSSAAEYVVVDDFESYENLSELQAVWNDYWVNGSGAEIFLDRDPNFVRDGASVILNYDNTYRSKGKHVGAWMGANPADLRAGADWTASGANTLAVHFRGDAGNSPTINDRMWVELEDTSSSASLVLYDGDANDLKEGWWHEWNIDLGLFDVCGVDLTEVGSVAIGFGGYERTGQTEEGGTGYVWFDDIRLYREGDVIPGLIAHWKFEEGTGVTAYDSVGSSHGTLINGPVWASGRIDGALEFDGVDDYADCGSTFADVVGSATKTIMAWAKSDTTSYPSQTLAGAGRILTLYRESGSSGFTIYAQGEPATWRGLYRKASNMAQDIDSGVFVVANEWAHVALVQDGADVDIYINGVSENSSSDAAAPTTWRHVNGDIGAYDAETAMKCFFDGSIDDVRIYDRALSAGEIQGIYEGGLVNTAPVACIVGGDRVVEVGDNCEERVVLDGSCSSDADSTEGTNDDINDFDWYEVIDACEPNSDVYLGSGEVIECNLGLGEHLIMLEVTDKAGAFDSNEVVITVEDVTPPELSVAVEPNILWPPNHKMVLITLSWEVSDNCDEEVEVSLVSVTSSEDDDSRGDGHTSKDIRIGDDGTIYLRAERSGKGPGRIYTITYQAVDDSGNVTEASATVTVPHRKGPVKRRGKSFSSLGGRLWRLLYRGGGQGR